ncbi:hypothetical protein AGMMS49949_09470 [Alphaproteobacteria bacterium]|nr:hypothetical protein AGMMS49949_09470 [Alphaproteobacteria bacterium]GHT00263.1 hypothetical protein AGMMS50296_8570 [Alphaproteobacteria bacterium]
MNDKKEGKGTHVWPDGQKYAGDWADDRQEGLGVATLGDGSVYYAGLFERGRPQAIE